MAIIYIVVWVVKDAWKLEVAEGGLRFAELRCADCGSKADEFLQIEFGPRQGVRLPLRLAIDCLVRGIGECSDVKGKRPSIRSRQIREAGHADAVDSLLDHLLKRENDSFACRASSVKAIGRSSTPAALAPSPRPLAP